jgi:NAD(P)-dependent dehydrogenase (short-subunit alcohol dehydrogenase family)
VADDGLLTGKVALITGGGQGIGRSIALSFAAAGATVAVASRTRANIEDVARECASNAIAISLDVTDERSCGDAIATCEREFGHLDILVNNAGIARSAKFTDTTTADWHETMAVDVDGPFWLIRAALPGMLARGQGTVVSIGSLASRQGFAYVAAYTAAKHALLGLTRSLAAEYARAGLTFNCVCPFYVDTPMTADTVRNVVAKTGRSEEQALAHLLSPQGRLISPDEVAAVCLLLASPAGRSITGQAINVDGGQLQA